MGEFKIMNDELKMDILKDLYQNYELFPVEIAPLFQVSTTCIARTIKKMGISRSNADAHKLSYLRGRSKGTRWRDSPSFIGAYKNCNGYNCLFEPSNILSRKDGYIFEHRAIWYKNHPDTPKEWIVHHINGIRDDNRIENLIAIPRKVHGEKTLLNICQSRIRKLEKEMRRRCQ